MSASNKNKMLTRSKKLVELATSSSPVNKVFFKTECPLSNDHYVTRVQHFSERPIAIPPDYELTELENTVIETTSSTFNPILESTKINTDCLFDITNSSLLGNTTFLNNCPNNISTFIPIFDSTKKIISSEDNLTFDPSDPYTNSGSEYVVSSNYESASLLEDDSEDSTENDKKFQRTNKNKENRMKTENVTSKKTKSSIEKKGINGIGNMESRSTDAVNEKGRISEIKNNEVENAKAKIVKTQGALTEKTYAKTIDRESQITENMTMQEGDDISTGVEIHCNKRNINEKRKRDKRYSCILCQNIVVNLARHLTTVHSSETMVAKILAYPKNSKKRREEFAKVTREGNFYHNCEVLQQKHGELILLRRPTPQEKLKHSYLDYGPCPDCLGFLLKKNINHHLKYNCCVKTSQRKNQRNPMAESNALLSGVIETQYSYAFTESILLKMRNDEVTFICRHDELILTYGAMMFEKFHTTQCELIRQHMRQLGRFLIEIRKISSITNLSECLEPSNFNFVVLATQSLCRRFPVDTKRPQFGIPSLALKIGHALRKCANFERGNALRSGNIICNRKIESFLSLMDIYWTIRISSNALNPLHTKKMNCPQLLPLTTDIIKLNNYLENEILKYTNDIEKINQPTQTCWLRYASLILTRIIIFNKRRSGEAAKMTMEQYEMRPLWQDQCTQELKNSLSDIEKQLAETMTVVQIPGKRNQHVPVLLTPDTKHGNELLIRTRCLAGISKDNKYIFARIGANLEYIRGHDALKKLINQIDLESPENISGTKLRKYIATVTQIMNLSENETDWLARHLGHDIRVHRNFYRLHEGAVELTKISRLLMAVDNGEINKFAGKKLCEVQLADLPELEINEEVDECDEVQKNDIQTQEASKVQKKKIPKKPEEISEKQKNTNARNRMIFNRTPWQDEEIKIILKQFKLQIKRNSIPGKQDCTECILNNPVLRHRKWTDIKFYIKNYLTKIRKLTNIK